MSIRSHKICAILIRYRAQWRQEDSSGNGYLVPEQGLTEKLYTGLFPNEEHARVWIEAKGKFLLDFELIKIVTTTPDVVIIEQAW